MGDQLDRDCAAAVRWVRQLENQARARLGLRQIDHTLDSDPLILRPAAEETRCHRS